MSSRSIGRRNAPRGFVCALVAATCAVLGARTGVAQQIAIGPPSFQADAVRSYDNDLLNRLELSGQYEPEDLSRLTWLSVLQSYVMQADVHNTLRGTPAGDMLETDISTFRDSADGLLEDLNSTDTSTTASQRFLFDQMQSAYGQLDLTLGGFPGVSNRAMPRLERVARMINATNFVMDSIDAGQEDFVPLPPDRALDVATLKTLSRLAANELVAFIEKARTAQPQPPAADDPMPALHELWTKLNDFNRSLALEPAYTDAKRPFSAIVRATNAVDAKISRLGWSALLRQPWHDARALISAMADEFRLPRTVQIGSPPRLGAQPARMLAASAATRVYRGSR
jgi:hypothetical protein